MNSNTIDKHEYAVMRDKLMRAVEHACRECKDPSIPGGNLDFDEPNKCACRCERTQGMLISIEGLRTPDADS